MESIDLTSEQVEFIVNSIHNRIINESEQDFVNIEYDWSEFYDFNNRKDLLFKFRPSHKEIYICLQNQVHGHYYIKDGFYEDRSLKRSIKNLCDVVNDIVKDRRNAFKAKETERKTKLAANSIYSVFSKEITEEFEKTFLENKNGQSKKESI